MNTKTILFAIIAGLAAAVMSAAPQSGSGFGLALSFFAAVPIIVVCLGWGTLSAIIASAIAALATVLAGDFQSGIVLALVTVLPAAWIGHMTSLSRIDDDGQETWFPLGDILFRATLYFAILTVALGIMVGFTTEKLTEAIAQLMREFLAQSQQQGQIDPDALLNNARYYAYVLPFVIPVSMMFLMLTNWLIATRLARNFNLTPRPRDYIAGTLDLPIMALPAFAVAVIASLLGGSIGLMAQPFVGALGFALSLVGLAVLHLISTGRSGRGALLAIVYTLILFLGIPLVIFTALGIAELLMRIRARRTPPPNP
ncbi:MAG: DUF2232 domain-containing protein [Pseudomonadota bacterium]